MGRNVWTPIYGGLFANHEGDPVAATADVYTVLDGEWADAMPQSGGIIANSTIGTITVPHTGEYAITAHMSSSCSGANIEVHHTIFVGGVSTSIELNRKYAQAGDIGAISVGGILTLAAGNVIDLRVKPTTTTNFLPEHMQFYVELKG